MHVIAHPAAIALALFLRRLQCHDPIRRSVIQIFAPASEHGTKGVEELQQQTVSLLSFKSCRRPSSTRKSASTCWRATARKPRQPLEEIELRIERHLATLLACRARARARPCRRLRLIQAPVFHGYSFSAMGGVRRSPRRGGPGRQPGESTQSTYAERNWSRPTTWARPARAASAVGAITPDRNHADACWFWLVADNLRLAAENAVMVARQLV